MRKIAIFVEGKTERVFVEKLIRLMIDEKKLKIAVFETSGGDKTPRRIRLIYQTPDDEGHEFYVQLMESRNDERVASDVRDRYESLVAAGFSAIVGIRDVYPDYTAAEIPLLRRALRFRIKTVPVDPVFVLGVMEVEAWFLSEHNHFPKIHANITCPRIAATFGFDPSSDDMQARACPRDDLHNIYQLEGFAYRKTGNQIQRTVDYLDYEYIYYEMIDDFEDLKVLIETLERFFIPPNPTAPAA
jgi:hypothetical protein